MYCTPILFSSIYSSVLLLGVDFFVLKCAKVPLAGVEPLLKRRQSHNT